MQKYAFFTILYVTLWQFAQSVPYVDDIDHIQAHLKGTINFARMSKIEYQMSYFKIHDTNSDGRLDGCELVHALVDHYNDNRTSKPPVFTDGELEFFIDKVLKKDDINNDGFIDIGEYLDSQNTQELTE